MGQEIRQMMEEVEVPCANSKVLIFDQDTEDLDRHAELFEVQGVEVHKCRSVETALRCVEREELDLALVDQGSPAFEGGRIIRHLVRYNGRAPFIVLARYKDMQCYQRAMELGAVDYLEKPVPKVQMEWIIRSFLRIPVTKY